MDIALSDGDKKIFLYYIDLLSSVINGKKPDEPFDGLDWKIIYNHASNNSVLNIVGYAINELKNKPPYNLYEAIENERRFGILKETSQITEIEKVLKEFDKAKIKNLPLKGYFMKRLYPHSDLRTMNDADILVRKEDFDKIGEIFESLGYTNRELINPFEIHYYKDFLYFEIHCDLNENDDSFFDDIWQRVSLRKGYDFSYNMNRPEDFYVYMLYHTAKHFKFGGAGIRMIMDVYVFLKSYPDLDFDYINHCFDKLNIRTFCIRLKELSLNWFSSDTTVIDNFGELILYCGTFGERNLFFYMDGRATKGNYWLKQIFIPYDKMKKKYLYLSKYPFLLPFSWVQYWFRRIFISRDVQYKSGMSSRVKNLDEKNSRFVSQVMSELEL